MTNKWILALLFLAACASKPVASTAWRSQCGDYAEIKYCYHEVGTPDLTRPAIVFNHGLKDSARVFLSPTSVPSDYPAWIKAMPVGSRILTMSWGDGFLVTPYANRTLEPATATVERYKEALAALSAKFGLAAPYRLVGHSMGGANTATLCQAAPDLFIKCALINPMLIQDSVDPWNLVQICPACLLVKPNYPDLKTWRASRPEPVLGMPPLWVSACPIDVFGLYSGTEQYVLQARKRDIKVKFMVGEGLCSHWTWDVKSLVTFLEAP